MNVTQASLSGAEAALTGLVVLVVVAFEATWMIVRYVVVMAHEGAHAILASLSGRGVESIKLRMNGDGVTKAKRGGGVSSNVAIGVVGYVGPSIFGLGAAKLVESGNSLSVFWIVLVLLVVLLLAVRWSFGYVTVILAGALAFFIARFAPMHAQVIAAYAIAWLLLLSGIRVIVDHGLRAGDAIILRDATHIPRLIWSLLWLAGALVALFIGGRMLVMPT